MGQGMRGPARRGNRALFGWVMGQTNCIRGGRSGRWCNGKNSLRRRGRTCFTRREFCGWRGKKVRGGGGRVRSWGGGGCPLWGLGAGGYGSGILGMCCEGKRGGCWRRRKEGERW